MLSPLEFTGRARTHVCQLDELGKGGGGWRILLTVLSLLGVFAHAQDIERQKQGVVRVLSQTQGATKTGTGFVVKVAPDRVYIVTATHVVQGAERIEVEFFATRDALVPAKVGKMEDDKDRGIAYLIVTSAAPPGAQALSFAPQSTLSEGTDEVLTLGFPQGAPGWSPKSLKFATRDGRELLFDGKVNQGNSGGPLLKDGQVVGLIQSERNGYVRANPANAVVEFLEGSGVKLGAAPEPDSAAAAVPQDALPNTSPAARVRVSEVVCDQEPDFVGVIAKGQASGPVGAIVQADFENKGSFFDIEIDCGAWSRWRYGVACVREGNAPAALTWRAKAKLSAVPHVVRAEVAEVVTADEVKPLVRDECRILSCDRKTSACAAAGAGQPPLASAPALSRPGIAAPASGAAPPAKGEVAALSPRFSWGETVRRSGVLILSTRGDLWLSAAGGADRNPVSNGASLAITGDEYVISSFLHAHRLPVKIVARTEQITAGEFMAVCEATNACVAPTHNMTDREFREKMQAFFLEVAKTALQRTFVR